MAAVERDLTADGYLTKLMENPSVLGYVVFNSDGIPMRYEGQGITHKVAVHYTALVSDFWQVARKTIQKQLKENSTLQPKAVGNAHGALPAAANLETEIEHVRVRTAKNTELLITACGDYLMVCIQRCAGMVGETPTGDEDKKSVQEQS